MLNFACVATSGAQPCTCRVSSSDPLWKPAVSESPRKTVFEKLPAFFACSAWMGASGLELPSNSQRAKDRERWREVCRRAVRLNEYSFSS